MVRFKKKLINEFVKRLPELNFPRTCLILFRRKWLIKNDPENEELYRQHFKSDEMCIKKFVIRGSFVDQITSSILMHLSSLRHSVDKKYRVKNNVYNIAYLYKTFPYAFSLMTHFHVPDLRKAVISLTKKCIDKLVDPCNMHFLQHVDKEWMSLLQKYADKYYTKYVLLDLDEFNLDKIEVFKQVLGSNIKYVRYACTTPSNGLHVVLEINENIQKLIFKHQRDFIEYLVNSEICKEPEIKTKFLTHVPSINPKIRDITEQIVL